MTKPAMKPHRIAQVFLYLFLGSITAFAADSPDVATYRRPAGVKVEIAASEPLVINPVTMTFGPDARLYVSEWTPGDGPNDRIRVLTDRDGDGRFDDSQIYMDRLELPAGILFWDSWTYVTLNHDVVRFQDRDGDGKFETRETIATGFGNDNSHHRVSGMMIGLDGYLYLTTGDSDAHARGSDGSEAVVLRSGGVFRCKPDGTRMENVAFGMRNPWGNVSFDDEFQIFHTDNDNEGSPGFTGCRLLHVVERGDYGWRLREGARCCAPDFERAGWNGGRPGRLGLLAETGRGAPAGLHVLNSAAFPQEYQNLLVYPDVFRKSTRAYKIKHLGATYRVAEEFELLASDDPLYRPDDAEVGPDGALYVSDWRTDSGGAGRLSGNGDKGRIYRLTWGGTDRRPAIKTFSRNRMIELVKKSDSDLIAALESTDFAIRRTASLELIRRGIKDVGPLAAVAVDRSKPIAARRHAVELLIFQAPDRIGSFWKSWMTDPDASIRRIAFEGASRQNDAGAWIDATLGFDEKAEKDPRVERGWALAAGRAASLLLRNPNDPDAAEKRAGAVADRLLDLGDRSLQDDAWLRDAATRGLEAIGPLALNATVRRIVDDAPKSSREAALFALEGWRNGAASATVMKLATTSEPLAPSDRVALFRVLRELVPEVNAGALAEWLERTEIDSAEPKVEAMRVLAALGAKAFPAYRAILPKLLADKHASTRLEALRVAGMIGTEPIERAIAAIAANESAGIDERRLAVESLGRLKTRGIAPKLAEMFKSQKDSRLKIEILIALSQLDSKLAVAAARSVLGDSDDELRGRGIAILGGNEATALDVARAYNAGKLPPSDLSRVIDAARRYSTPEIEREMQKLMKDRLLAAPQGEEAKRLREFVSRQGNAMRGREIFLDAKKAGCATCHRLEGIGGSIGPDLTRSWQTLSFDKRVESILEPSREIKEGYATYKVASKDGRVVSGLLLSDKPDGVTLKDATGKEIRIAAADIEEKSISKESLMPVGVVGHLSFAELADLLAFLGDRAAQEGLRSRAK